MAPDGAYILTPCANKSNQDIVNFFNSSISIAAMTNEHATVGLANATTNPSVYDTAYRLLTDAGLSVSKMNAVQDNPPQTLVYQASTTPQTAAFITQTLNAQQTATIPVEINMPKSPPDVIVVLGASTPAQPAPPLYIPPPALAATTTPASASSSPTSATTTPSNASSTSETATSTKVIQTITN